MTPNPKHYRYVSSSSRELPTSEMKYYPKALKLLQRLSSLGALKEAVY